MKAGTVTIDKSRVVGNILFATHGDRCWYLGRSPKDQARWLENNRDHWTYVQDLKKAADLSCVTFIPCSPWRNAKAWRRLPRTSRSLSPLLPKRSPRWSTRLAYGCLIEPRAV